MKKPFLFFLIACTLHWTACTLPTNVFEKNVVIPHQSWEGSFQPRIDFTIKDQDTAFLYNISIVLRHTDAYAYNNIWIRGTIKEPGDTATRSERYDLPLSDNTKGWLGQGMDDIYEQRVLIQHQTKFRKPGTYSFTLQQAMREDPLPHVLNVGVRIEKVPGQ